jgi:predicted nucleic acid-binding protein
VARFWDASGIIPLTIDQPATAVLRRALADDAGVVVWWGTTVEVRSALARLTREDLLSDSDAQRAARRLSALRRVWREILPSEQVRVLAEEIPERHPVTAGDAFQLAAAILWCRNRPRDRTFVCIDRRLALVAARAGFAVAPRSP